MPDLEIVPPGQGPPPIGGPQPSGGPGPFIPPPPTPPPGALVPPPASPASPPGGAAEYGAIFDQPKRSWLKTLLIGLVVLVLLVGVAGAINRFVYDLGLGEYLPFFARPAQPIPTTETVETSQEATVGNEAKERDLQRKADLALIQSALTVYQEQQGAFPTTVGRVKLDEPGNRLEVALVPSFLQSIPSDPQSPQFTYQYQSDGQTYSLSSIIEDSSDPQAKSGGTYYFYELNPAASQSSQSPQSPQSP